MAWDAADEQLERLRSQLADNPAVEVILAAVSEYLGLLHPTLRAWQPLLEMELVRITGFHYHPEVDLLHFEFFDDSTTEDFFPFFLYAQRKQDGPQDYSLPFPTTRKFFQPPAGSDFF